MNKNCNHNLYIAVSYPHPYNPWQKVMVLKCDKCNYAVIKHVSIFTAPVMHILKPSKGKTKALKKAA